MQSMQIFINELKVAQKTAQQNIIEFIFKSSKLVKYEEGFKDTYQTFIKECEKRFENKNVQIDREKIKGVITYLKNTANQV